MTGAPFANKTTNLPTRGLLACDDGRELVVGVFDLGIQCGPAVCNTNVIGSLTVDQGLAMAIYDEARLRERIGLSARALSFNQVADAWVKALKEEADDGLPKQRNVIDYTPT